MYRASLARSSAYPHRWCQQILSAVDNSSANCAPEASLLPALGDAASLSTHRWTALHGQQTARRLIRCDVGSECLPAENCRSPTIVPPPPVCLVRRKQQRNIRRRAEQRLAGHLTSLCCTLLAIVTGSEASPSRRRRLLWQQRRRRLRRSELPTSPFQTTTAAKRHRCVRIAWRWMHVKEDARDEPDAGVTRATSGAGLCFSTNPNLSFQTGSLACVHCSPAPAGGKSDAGPLS